MTRRAILKTVKQKIDAKQENSKSHLKRRKKSKKQLNRRDLKNGKK